MLLQRLNPAVFNAFGPDMERLFEDFTRPFNGGFLHAGTAFPALNVWEDADHIYAEAEIPGVRLEDVELSVVGSELSIKGARKASHEGNMTFHRQERGTGEFSRFVTLPTAVNAEKVEAVVKDGVLTITLPKAEQAKARRIEVKTK